MNKEECFLLGSITKTHGLKGDLIVYISRGDASGYKQMESVFVEISKQLVPFFIESIVIRKQQAIIRFEDIDTFEKARELIGKDLYLPLSLAPEEDDLDILKGFTVIDKQKGELGILEKVLDYPGQLVAQVKSGEKELLFPLNENLITRIDKKKKQLFVDLPEGLVDIYLD
jgi:16S rRNA processing protein RimM